mmetsp:Transcript_35019/g.108387  ORF Transcript_35019/g.108387 Transcript_35019/m.108387 type:complete len:128 (+) Transcript_35019:522-905(+)
MTPSSQAYVTTIVAAILSVAQPNAIASTCLDASMKCRRISRPGKHHARSLESHVTIRCYSTKEVDRVNPKFPLTAGGRPGCLPAAYGKIASGLAKESIDRMLCVRYDNSKSRGRFYNVSPVMDMQSV